MTQASAMTAVQVAAAMVDHVSQPLTAAQQTFRQLTDHIKQQQQALQHWQATAMTVRQMLVGQLWPLYDEIAACHMQLIQQLEVVLGSMKLNPRQQAQLADVILMLADHIADSSISEPQAIWLAQVVARYQPAQAAPVMDSVQDEQQHIEQLRASIQQAVDDAYGVDVAEAPEDELHFWAQQLAADFGAVNPRKQHKAPRKQALKPSKENTAQSNAAQRPTKPSDDVLAQKSLKLVYQRLAARLHPDRERDEVQKVKKTALLQAVNHAYQHKDLVALLNFKHEYASPHEPSHAVVSDEQLRLYTINLEKHAQQLAVELAQVRQQLACEIHSDVLVEPKQAVRWVKQHIQQTQHWIHQIQYAQTHLNTKHQLHAFLQQFDQYARSE